MDGVFLEDDLLSKMRDASLCITIWTGELTARLCVEFGAAILLDKPLVVVTQPDTIPVPAPLKRHAARIVQVDFDVKNLHSQQKLADAILEVAATIKPR